MLNHPTCRTARDRDIYYNHVVYFTGYDRCAHHITETESAVTLLTFKSSLSLSCTSRKSRDVERFAPMSPFSPTVDNPIWLSHDVSCREYNDKKILYMVWLTIDSCIETRVYHIYIVTASDRDFDLHLYFNIETAVWKNLQSKKRNRVSSQTKLKSIIVARLTRS